MCSQKVILCMHHPNELNKKNTTKMTFLAKNKENPIYEL